LSKRKINDNNKKTLRDAGASAGPMNLDLLERMTRLMRRTT